LKEEVENKNGGDTWYRIIENSIDKSQLSAHSDYETYGQWMLLNYPEEMRREYWFNTAMSRSYLTELDNIKLSLKGKYRSVSFHSYLS
jgi:hypothetical protein